MRRVGFLASASVRRRVESLFVLPGFTPMAPTFVREPFHRHVYGDKVTQAMWGSERDSM